MSELNFDDMDFEDVNFGPSVKEDGNLTVNIGKSVSKGDKLNMSIMMKAPFAKKFGYEIDMPLGFQFAKAGDDFFFRLPKIEASHAKLRKWGTGDKLRVMFSNIKDPGIKKGRYVFNEVETSRDAIVFKLDRKADVSNYIRKQIIDAYQDDGSSFGELSNDFGLDEEIIREVLIEEKVITS